ncbi:MAG: cobalamin B12-binding domain-containing protein, partial [Candidatus Methanoperedens sp.]
MKNKVMLFYGMFEDNQAYAYIPWSMIYLATYLRKHKFDPIIIDEFTSPEIEEAIKEYAQESITFGVSAMTGRQITAGLEAIRSFKSINKEARIVLGGAHSTALPEESLMNESIDYAFSGQSFLSLPLLLQSMSTKQQSEDRRTIYADYPT